MTPATASIINPVPEETNATFVVSSKKASLLLATLTGADVEVPIPLVTVIPLFVLGGCVDVLGYKNTCILSPKAKVINVENNSDVIRGTEVCFLNLLH